MPSEVKNTDDMALLTDTTLKPDQLDTKTLRRHSESIDGRSGKSTETLCTAPESQSRAGSKSSSSDDPKNDDLFLNLANADGAQGGLSKAEKRNVRFTGSVFALIH